MAHRSRALAVGVLALAMAELAAALATALAGHVSWADAVGSFTVTNDSVSPPS